LNKRKRRTGQDQRKSLVVAVVKRRPGRPVRAAGNAVSVKNRMLAVSAALFADRGYAAVSIRDIARRSGVTLSSLYHHFGDKRGLYAQVHLDQFGQSSARLEAALRLAAGDDTRLLSFVIELCRVLAEPGPLYKLVTRHWLEADPEVVRSLARATVPVQFGEVVRAIGAVAPSRDPKAMAVAIYALVYGLITLRMFEDSLTRRPAVSRTPVSLAEFALASLLPEVDWKAVRAQLTATRRKPPRGRA
jgi:TetR/AcrR family transcriptional regulator